MRCRPRGSFVETCGVNFLRHLFLAVLLAGALPFCARAQRLSPLAEKPDWTRLEAFQETITRADFERLLARPSFDRVLREAQPFFQYFPYYESMPGRFRNWGV